MAYEIQIDIGTTDLTGIYCRPWQGATGGTVIALTEIAGAGGVYGNAGSLSLANGEYILRGYDSAHALIARSREVIWDGVSFVEVAGRGTINTQDVADALKLAPTAGTPAAGSVYAELDSLLAGIGGSLSYDLPQFIALMRADTAFKRALSEGALIAGLSDELALVKTQVWTRSDVRTAWDTLITNVGVTTPSVGEITAWNGYAALLPGLSFAANGEVSYAG